MHAVRHWAFATLEIIVVTSMELLEAVQNLVDTVTRFDWATHEFKPYDFGTFERTAEYTKLAKDKNWLSSVRM